MLLPMRSLFLIDEGERIYYYPLTVFSFPTKFLIKVLQKMNQRKSYGGDVRTNALIYLISGELSLNGDNGDLLHSHISLHFFFGERRFEQIHFQMTYHHCLRTILKH